MSAEQILVKLKKESFGDRPVEVLRDLELFLALPEVLGIETELEQEIRAFSSEPLSAQTGINPESL